MNSQDSLILSPGFPQKCRTIAESNQFQIFITVTILLAAVLVGVETYQNFAEKHHTVLEIVDQIILGIFIIEIAVKMLAEGKKPWNYFKDSWNIFDFSIVAASFLPINAQYVVVLRLVRLLRVLKLIRNLPELQVLVEALFKSIPSMTYVSIFLFLLFYIYGVTAVFLFSANDPIHFGNLQISLLSLFRVVTLEDWTDVMYIQMFGCQNYGYEGNEALCTSSHAFPLLSPVFFVSFVLFGTMIVLNLFIGIIMNSMQQAQEESNNAAGTRKSVPASSEEVMLLRGQLLHVQEQLDVLVSKKKAKTS